MTTALLLIALGFGYKIYAEACVGPKKKFKKLGKIVGIFIMVISVCGIACGMWHRGCKTDAGWKKAGCPFSSSQKYLQKSASDSPSAVSDAIVVNADPSDS